MNVYSDFAIPAFGRHVTIYNYILIGRWCNEETVIIVLVTNKLEVKQI
jgi:hypothetical protein